MTRMEKLQQVVDSADRYTMRSAKGRKGLAHKIAGELGLWEQPVQDFVRDMVGLNFYNTEDRQTFILFFLRAYQFDV